MFAGNLHYTGIFLRKKIRLIEKFENSWRLVILASCCGINQNVNLLYQWPYFFNILFSMYYLVFGCPKTNFGPLSYVNPIYQWPYFFNILFSMYYLVFGCPNANFGPLPSRQPHSSSDELLSNQWNTIKFWPEFHREPCDKVGSLSRAEPLVEFEPWFRD